MPNATETHRQTCPSWCTSRHPAEHRDGFFHGSHPQPVRLGDDKSRRAAQLQVVVSKFAPATDDAGTDYPVHVELRGGNNSGSMDLTLLSPAEARQLALALLDAAATAYVPS